jgi:hypothetical protein
MKIWFTRQSRGSARRRRTPLARRTTVAVAALSALLLAGCGGGTTSSDSQASVGGGAVARDSAQSKGAPETQFDAAAPGAPASGSKPASAVVSIAPKLTKSASLDLRVKNISAAAARVRGIAVGLQALILSEQIGKGGPGGPTPDSTGGGATGDLGGFGTLTLSVPSDKLDTALDQLSSKQVGTVLQRSTTSQDVTSQYVDTQSRLKTMTASVERVRALMAQAKDLGQVVALEGELSRRESDLESLQSQMDALKTSVERSTLAVSLSTPGNEPVTDNGFMAGLRSGWDAFTASAAGLFRGVGAVLPFALFLALVGVPLWWWLRGRAADRPRVVASPAAPAAPAGPAAPAAPSAT